MKSGSADALRPCRGEVWIVSPDTTVGAEIQKTRPAVVVSSDAIGTLRIKTIVPITTWNETFEGKLWLVKVEPDKSNGLQNTSAADALQIRGISMDRFVEKIGRVSSEVLDNITAAISIVVEYQ